ncbi:DUF3047 domain-containing protein [Candidatus Uabimicrobium sp. HlEnr_7]|uniref:DUF3047 domain-containing protein n=1 Tax=Candidatus Uabimicrobium helgolandensis TaxID=3095367 RepID=UPI0035583D58
MTKYIVLVLFLACCTHMLSQTFISENFHNLDHWSELKFSSISPSKYSIVKQNRKSYLKAKSNSSASGIIHEKVFNVYKYPNLEWRWKINNIFQRGNAFKKTGDDYPIRVFVMFEFNPEKASFTQILKYKAIKAIHGRYPPHSTLSYIWANRYHRTKVITSPYVDNIKMIVASSGSKNAKTWVTKKVNLIDDYKKAFSKKPPKRAKIAIMIDSDNTKEKGFSFVDYIKVYSVNKK